MKKILKVVEVVRTILSVPFMILGFIGFRLAELVAGKMYTYRAAEVKNFLLRQWGNSQVPQPRPGFRSKSAKKR